MHYSALLGTSQLSWVFNQTQSTPHTKLLPDRTLRQLHRMHACKPYVRVPNISKYSKYSIVLRILDKNLCDYPSSPVCYMPRLANSPKYDHYNNIPNKIPLCDWLNHTILATITSDVSWRLTSHWRLENTIQHSTMRWQHFH